MANTYVDYTATASQTDFAFSFPYLEDEHVTVTINGVATTDFTIVTSPSTKIVLDTGATAGQSVRVQRVSAPDENLVDFQNGSVLTERELDRAYLHNRYLAEESAEQNDISLRVKAGADGWDGLNKRLFDLLDPVDEQDAATKNYVDGVIGDAVLGTVPDDSITYAKIQDVTANNVLLGNDNGAGEELQELNATEVRAILNVADGANNYSHPNHTGDVTSTGDGATVIANDAVTAAKIEDNAVTAAKIDSTGNYTVAAIGVGGGTFASTAIYPLQGQGGSSFAYLKSDVAGGSSFVLENVNTGSASLGITFISGHSTINTTNNRFDLGFRHTSGAFYLGFKDNTAPTVTKKAVALQQDGHFRPDDNGSQDLGVTGTRWDDVWSNGTFNGSDRNLKQDIQDLDEAEKRVAVKCKGLIKKYRLKDAVAKKGNDARIHVGIIAQGLQAAFESEGLDPFRYSMIGKDTWWEGTDEEGNRDVKYEATAGYTEVTQMSVRYNELLAFIISAL